MRQSLGLRSRIRSGYVRRGSEVLGVLDKGTGESSELSSDRNKQAETWKNLLDHGAKNSGVYVALGVNGFRGSKVVALITQSFTFLTPDQSSVSYLVHGLPSWCQNGYQQLQA